MRRQIVPALLATCWVLPALLPPARLAAQGARDLTPAEAKRLLAQPPKLEPKAVRLLDRVSLAYGKLKSLESTTRGQATIAVSRCQRPLLYHYLQKSKVGDLIATSVSDGARYYEYTESRKIYVEREADLLRRLALPVNARHFFSLQKPGETLLGMSHTPVVREYAFRYGGQATIRGRKADRLLVQTMVHLGQDRWNTFESARYYDAQTALLLRVVNGDRVLDVDNKPNVALPAKGFRWTPPPGATKGFG